MKESYYNKNHIGKIEIICFDNQWTENQIKDKINDDPQEYDLSYHLSKYTKYSGLEIKSILKNCYNNIYFYYQSEEKDNQSMINNNIKQLCIYYEVSIYLLRKGKINKNGLKMEHLVN